MYKRCSLDVLDDKKETYFIISMLDFITIVLAVLV